MSFILAGDIGGTNARFALLEPTGHKVLYQEVFESRTFATFEAALARFLDRASDHGIAKIRAKGAIRAASFGIAGPIINQRVKTTNLPWVIDAASVKRRFELAHVTLLNDLVAIGLGALNAAPSKLRSLHQGKPRKTGHNLAVIAAGTGLGEAFFVWDGTTYIPCPNEGGHVDFAPRSPVESELLKSLTKQHGHVSYERIASGSTISVLYNFFVDEQRVPESKANAALIAGAADKNVAIVDLAERGASEAAMRTIELWAGVYGAEAGNLALKTLATGGVFICGGVSTRLADVLAKGLPKRRKATSTFLEGFLDKGRMRPILESIPIAVCIEPRAGLLGAAAHAAQTAAKRPATRKKRR